MLNKMRNKYNHHIHPNKSAAGLTRTNWHHNFWKTFNFGYALKFFRFTHIYLLLIKASLSIEVPFFSKSLYPFIYSNKMLMFVA